MSLVANPDSQRIKMNLMLYKYIMVPVNEKDDSIKDAVVVVVVVVVVFKLINIKKYSLEIIGR